MDRRRLGALRAQRVERSGGRLAAHRKCTACGQASGWRRADCRFREAAHHRFSRRGDPGSAGAARVVPKDFSWAVIESPEPPAIKVEDSRTELRMTAGRVVVIVKKAPLLITFADLAGNVLLADEPSLPVAWDGTYIHAWKRMPSEENYFGL